VCELDASVHVPLVTIVLTAKNEEAVIVDSVGTVLASSWKHLEVIVVEDGSTDQTLAVLTAAFHLAPVALPVVHAPLEHLPVVAAYRSADGRLTVISKPSAGSKADAANAGLARANGTWVAVADGDQLFEPDAISRAVAGALGGGDGLEHVVAVGGTLLPANGCTLNDDGSIVAGVPRSYLATCQFVEYLRSFTVGRVALGQADAIPIVSGGFGLFRRESAYDVGGMSHGHIGEDLDFTIRLRRLDLRDGHHSVVQVPESVVWTEVPSDWKSLGRQRRRWERGLRQVVSEHGELIRVGRQGRFGWVGMGYMVVYEYLAIFAMMAGLAVLAISALAGWVSWQATMMLVAANFFVGAVTNAATLAVAARMIGRFDRPGGMWRLGWCAVSEQFIYRPACVWWRLTANRDSTWHSLPRTGFSRTST
jgi:cellulose synthase/poly-beta-1,6-N-acetylglucosamine synthase-like glycosyltransferase